MLVDRLVDLFDWFLPVNGRKVGLQRAERGVVEVSLVTTSELGLQGPGGGNKLRFKRGRTD